VRGHKARPNVRKSCLNFCPLITSIAITDKRLIEVLCRFRCLDKILTILERDNQMNGDGYAVSPSLNEILRNL
jgi:hypothetical protein